MKMWISGSAVSWKYTDIYEKIYNKIWKYSCNKTESLL